MHGNWKQQSQLLKLNFPKLTDADLVYTRGNIKELLRKLEVKLNMSRNEVIVMIKEVQPIQTKVQLKEWKKIKFVDEKSDNVKANPEKTNP